NYRFVFALLNKKMDEKWKKKENQNTKPKDNKTSLLVLFLFHTHTHTLSLSHTHTLSLSFFLFLFYLNFHFLFILNILLHRQIHLHLLNPCQPLHSPSQAQPSLHVLQRIHPPPYPRQHTSEQTHALHTSDQTCDQGVPKLQRLRLCC